MKWFVTRTSDTKPILQTELCDGYSAVFANVCAIWRTTFRDKRLHIRILVMSWTAFASKTGILGVALRQFGGLGERNSMSHGRVLASLFRSLIRLCDVFTQS